MKACICIDILLFCTERTAEATPSKSYDVIIAATPADDELVAFIKGGFHELVIVSMLNVCRRSSCYCEALLFPVQIRMFECDGQVTPDGLIETE